MSIELVIVLVSFSFAAGCAFATLVDLLVMHDSSKGMWTELAGDVKWAIARAKEDIKNVA